MTTGARIIDEQFEKWKSGRGGDMINGFSADSQFAHDLFDSARKPLEEEIQKRDEAARDMEAHNPINHVGVESYYERAKWTFSMQQSEISRLTAEVERLTVERNDAETRVAKTTNQFAETTQRLRADKKALEAEIDGTKGSYLRSQSEVTVLTADNKRLREAMEKVEQIILHVDLPSVEHAVSTLREALKPTKEG